MHIPWELDRHNWPNLRCQDGDASHIPAALADLVNALSSEDVKRAYWRIDNYVIVQGALYEAAVPTASCLVAVMPRCTSAALTWALELMVQLGNGETAPEEKQIASNDLRAECIRELLRGVGMYFDILQHGNDEQSLHCVDLLGLCAIEDTTLRARVKWTFSRLVAERSNHRLRMLVEDWMDEI